MPRGGARPNSGPKKGAKYAKTLDKEMAREVLRDMVKAALRPMTEAQIANAMGIKYLVRRDKSGKFTPLSEDQFKEAIAAGEAVELYEKIPNVQAFQDLLDRTLDKPTQSVSMKADVSGTINVVDRLAEARKMLNEGKRG